MPDKVLVIYTGGTIGMLPKDRLNPFSPLAPAAWEELEKTVVALQALKVKPTILQMKLIDSSDMSPTYWVDIAKKIRDEYDNYTGFVVLHGTDTMAYTATALSFLLENLGKPVVVTGSQQPIGYPRTDAVQNLVTALMLASPLTYRLPLVPEVMIYFSGRLLRGNRSRKVSSTSYEGFDSPNFGALGHSGEHIVVDRSLIRSLPSADLGFFINENLEANVLMFDVFPGLRDEILRSVFDIPGLSGVVLRTFGAGNTPTRRTFLDNIEYGVRDKQLTIVNVTQCQQGMVEQGLYEASATLERLGVISGVDMTPEAALVKMQFLLGLGYRGETLKAEMQKNLRGEQSVDVSSLKYETITLDSPYRAEPRSLPSVYRRENLVAASVRLDEVTPAEDGADVEVAVFVNYPQAEGTRALTFDAVTAIPQCLGVMGRSGAADSMVMDCTSNVARVVFENRPLQLTLVSRKGTVTLKRAVLSFHTSSR